MEQIRSRLAVFFEDPFWVALYERESDGKYEVCKVTFGPEPKDYVVYQYFLDNWRQLRFSPSVEAAAIDERRRNPKRLQREAKKQVQSAGIGTKAQQALKLQQEEGKLARKTRTRAERETEAERQFQIRQEKRREKHRGH